MNPFRPTLAALVFSLAAVAAHASPAAEPAPPTRAEVLADLALYQRAGLDGSEYREGFNSFDSTYQARVAAYRRLRSGPEFAAEVARIEARGTDGVATRPAQVVNR